MPRIIGAALRPYRVACPDRALRDPSGLSTKYLGKKETDSFLRSFCCKTNPSLLLLLAWKVVKVSTLLAERWQGMGYEKQMAAAVTACR